MINMVKFNRQQNGLFFKVPLDIWREGMLLPSQAEAFMGGLTPFEALPYWQFGLKDDQTRKASGGRFEVPWSVADTLNWYQTELAKTDWHCKSISDRGSSANLQYYRDDGFADETLQGMTLFISIGHIPKNGHSIILFRQTERYHWQPIVLEELEDVPVYDEDESNL